jgi:hypothetical protein
LRIIEYWHSSIADVVRTQACIVLSGLSASIRHPVDLVGVAVTCVGPVALDAEGVGERDAAAGAARAGHGERATHREGCDRDGKREAVGP